MDLEGRILDVAVEAARKAGSFLVGNMGQPVDFSSKSKRNYVTPLDARAEEMIIASIRSEFPDHSVHAEESGESRRSGEYTWIVDPISSTRNFIHGLPHWAVCIAVEGQSGPVAGVVHDPFTGEVFSATASGGASRNGAPIKVSSTPDIERAMMCASFSVEGDEAEESISQGLGYFSRLCRVADLRSFGSSGLHLSFVASGRFEAFVSNSPDYFTATAGSLLVRKAGGVVTDFEGRQWTTESTTLAASNGKFHDRLLRVVRGDLA